MLRDHRGLSIERRIKAVFWWCYMHSPEPLSANEIIKVMPTDKSIAEIYRKMFAKMKPDSIIPLIGVMQWYGASSTTQINIQKSGTNHQRFLSYNPQICPFYVPGSANLSAFPLFWRITLPDFPSQVRQPGFFSAIWADNFARFSFTGPPASFKWSCQDFSCRSDVTVRMNATFASVRPVLISSSAAAHRSAAPARSSSE